MDDEVPALKDREPKGIQAYQGHETLGVANMKQSLHVDTPRNQWKALPRYKEDPAPVTKKGQYLHFLCDVPHVIKCIRNHLLTHTYGMAGTHKVNFNDYKLLYKTEEDRQLKDVPKLTTCHVNPSNLKKMNVKLATQLFSRSVAIGMNIYREQKTPGFQDTQGTEKFTLLINDLFDALNARIPVEGIRKDSPKIQVIKEFLQMLNAT
ncbi:hypothetical protein HPB49_004862 [Dermacentor silvarum]|uniref:Uncharacterized protein n=1 Tax=Dermacentor silvarum TaxID=543639 RepID=A0ACB8CVT0_DERSI|nr:hypothetical protein HPB49_004862 [Dermacentor silvarum]